MTVAPVLAAFHSAARNQRYASDRYEAAMQADLALAYAGRADDAEFIGADVPFLSRDKYDFVINGAGAAELRYGAPPVTPGGAERWDTSDTRCVYNGPDGVLVLEGPFPVINEARAVVVDVYDKDGQLLARAAQVSR